MRLGDRPYSGAWCRSAGGRCPSRQNGGRAGDRGMRVGPPFTLGESLGSVESLIEVPAAMTHLSVSESALAVDPALVRLSVGIEDARDLIADLAQALDRA